VRRLQISGFCFGVCGARVVVPDDMVQHAKRFALSYERYL